MYHVVVFSREGDIVAVLSPGRDERVNLLTGAEERLSKYEGYGAIAVLKIGNDVLFNQEHVKVDRITGHGGLFKTPGVGQRILAAALNSPISVMETAGEGGAWGIALLASYLVNNGGGLKLPDFLDKVVFAGNTGVEIAPDPADIKGFETYLANYKAAFPIERAAVECKK